MSWKRFLTVSSLLLAGCKSTGSVRLYTVDPDLGLTRNGQVIPWDSGQLQCLEFPDGSKDCPYGAASWEDIRTIIENCREWK
jgi:hypothetical protein